MQTLSTAAIQRSLPYILTSAFVAVMAGHVDAQVPFQRGTVDNVAGDVKLVGDIDGDGAPDLVIGGMPAEKLNWYRWTGSSNNLQKTTIATPSNEFTTDGTLGDVDGDGALDIIVPDGNTGNNLHWFRNPRIKGDPTVGSQWTRNTIGSVGSWGKDVRTADFDHDGRLDVAVHSGQGNAMVFYQTAANSWTHQSFAGVAAGEEGMAIGDIDQDGWIDLVVQGQWLRNPGGSPTNVRTHGNWTSSAIGPVEASFKAVVADLNGDGKVEVVFSNSEGTGDLKWFSYGSGGPTGSWTQHTVEAMLERAHTLAVADMNLDGKLDIVTGQMHTSSDKQLLIYYNLDGSGGSWSKQVIDNVGIHNGVVADLGGDGDMDIIGANWTGNPPFYIWENMLPEPGALGIGAMTIPALLRRVNSSRRRTAALYASE